MPVGKVFSARSALAGLACAFLLGGCGGGGGGGAGSSTGSSPAPVVAPPSETPLTLTTQNYGDAAAFATGYAEVGLMLAQLARDWSDAVAASRTTSLTQLCDGGGSLTLQLSDKDGNSLPSPGDELVATLSQCYVRVLDDVFDGSASVVFSTPATGATMAGVWRFGPRFETGASAKIQLQGELAWEILADALNYIVRAQSSALPLKISGCAGSTCLQDSITQLDARKDLHRDTARITSSWKLRIASNVLGGSLEVSTPTPLVGWFNEWPTEGRVEAKGAGGAVAALQPDSLAGFRYSMGSTSRDAIPTDVATGYLWWAAGITPPGPGTRGYRVEQRGPNSFAVLSRPVDGPTRQFATQVWQLSRPGVGSAPTAVFRRADSFAGGYFGSSDYEIPADVSLQGALLRVTPRTGLQQGLSYQVIWGQRELQDASGASVPLDSVLLTVTESVTADASRSGGKLLFGSSGSLVLDGRASRSADGSALASVQWRQVSGPALQISSPNTLQPTVTPATGPDASGVAELELEVKNSLGEFDRDRISIPVVNNAKPYRLFALQPASGPMIYRVSANDPLVDGNARVFARDGGGQVLQVGQSFPGIISTLLVSQSIGFSAGQSNVTDGQNVALAFLDSAVSGGCTAGSWTLGEIKTSPLPDTTALSLDQLALDISLSCGAQGPSKLYVRLNSNRPLP
jgi:hypothetical protein